MILTGDFCAVTDLQAAADRWTAQLHWNAGHAVFAGHFPGQPVVPGVCMIQVVQEVMEAALGRRLQLVSSGSIKFLQFIDPRVNAQTGMEIKRLKEENGEYAISAQISNAETVFFKFSAVYRQREPM